MCENCRNTIPLPDDDEFRAMIEKAFLVQGDEVYVEVGAAMNMALEVLVAVAGGTNPTLAVNVIGAMSQKAIEMDAAAKIMASVPDVPEPPQNTQLF